MAQLSKIQNRIAIVGAGPAGVYCALHILENLEKNNIANYLVDIIDKSQILRTLLPTGNGRCNLSNEIYDIKELAANYPRGEKFLYSIFSKHSNFDSINFFNSIGIKTYTQEDNRIFPKSNSAKDVKDKLINCLKKYKNYRLINKEINSIEQLKEYNIIVISTGTKSQNSTYSLLNSINQPYTNFKPSLTSLKIDNHIYPKGVSIRAADGDFIFTHQGISGPLVYKLSSLNKDKAFPYNLTIKLFNYDSLEELAKNNPKKSIGAIISKLIPKSLARVIIKDYNKHVCEISKKELESLTKIEFRIISNCKGEEIVNSGGVDLKSVDNNCKSKINLNIWFCGEILDIDGFCGGFNLQNCWSSGYVVALNVVDVIKNKLL